MSEKVEKMSGKVEKMSEKGVIKLGNLDVFEDGWFAALKCLAIRKISEATGELAMEFCGDDESFHVITASGKLFLVCYADVTDVFAIEEVQCPRCRDYVPVDMLEEHKEFCAFE